VLPDWLNSSLRSYEKQFRLLLCGGRTGLRLGMQANVLMDNYLS
jgi:hypothetical protein